MPRVVVWIILTLVLTGPASGLQISRRARSRNRPPKVHSFRPSISVVDSCPIIPVSICSKSGTIITLEVQASDPDREQLDYKYSPSDGVIAGSGAIVKWDVTKARLGFQTVKVEVADQRGGRTSSIAQVKIEVCGACDPGCPVLTVSCPTSVTKGAVATFEATYSGDPDFTRGKLIYVWSHCNGKRLSGTEETKLKIEATGLPGDVITAKVRVVGVDPFCNREATCQTRIVK